MSEMCDLFERDTSPLGEQCAGPLHLAVLIFGGYPTQILAQFSKDVTLEATPESTDEIAWGWEKP